MFALRTLLLLALMLTTSLITSSFVISQDAVQINSAPNVTAENSKLHARLLGAWELAGRPGTNDRLAPGIRMRFFGEHHWLITQADPATGVVTFHHGGTYTLDGDILTAKTTFATTPTANMIGQETKFKISVDNETYTQIGIGNPWSEVWRRATKAAGR